MTTSNLPKTEDVDPVSLDRPLHDVEMPMPALLGPGVLLAGIVLVVTAIDRAQQLLGLAILAGVLGAVLAPANHAVGRVIGRVAATVLAQRGGPILEPV